MTEELWKKIWKAIFTHYSEGGFTDEEMLTVVRTFTDMERGLVLKKN